MRFEPSEESSSKGKADDSPGCRSGYIYLSKHPGVSGPDLVKKSMWLHELVTDYRGPVIRLDFDAENELIGIGIVEE